MDVIDPFIGELKISRNFVNDIEVKAVDTNVLVDELVLSCFVAACKADLNIKRATIGGCC